MNYRAEYPRSLSVTPRELPFCGTSPSGETIAVNSLFLTKNGKPWFPVMGEFHFSRYDKAGWETELLKMKAGGVEIVATYVFWIHHEEEPGVWNFEGNRNLRDFLLLCRKHGLFLFLRIGPWVHGECRNGGFPDWIVRDPSLRSRTNDPRYLEAVTTLYQKIGEQARGMMWKDGGPVIGVQIENEYWCDHPEAPGVGVDHMRTLKRLAVEAGLVAPLYTATAWKNAVVVEGEMLPVESGYVDAPWDQSTDELPESPNFLMQARRDDPLVGCDLCQTDSAHTVSAAYGAPYLTAELGGGMQPTDHRRVVAFPRDTEALAFCKLGSGACLLGYYMYHGGTNPDGARSTLQESKEMGYPNDLPVKSYDFEAPIGESGLVSESYGRLRRLHLFLHEWGSLLAPSIPLIPADSCREPADLKTLRYAVRHNPQEHGGFVFVNNHLRKRVLADHENVRITVSAEGHDYTLPPVHLKNGENAILPYHLRMGDTLLLGANATPLTRLGRRYFFYTDQEPIYQFEGTPAEIVTLSREQARMACKLGDRLYLCDKPLYEKDGEVHVQTDRETTVTIYEETGEPKTILVRPPVCSGGVSFRETAPGAYELTLEYGSLSADYVLKLDFLGDKARLYQEGKRIADWFSTGLSFCTALRQHGFPAALTLEIDASRPGIYTDLTLEPGRTLKSAVLIPVCDCKIE